MADFFRAALVAAALAAAAGAPALATPQIAAPTGAVLPRGAPILVQWTPSYWASSTVSIALNRASPTSMAFGNLAANIPNNGQAYVNLPYAFECDPAYTYRLTVWAKINSTTWMTYDSASFKLSCEGGTIAVVKTVINDSGGPIPNGSFQVGVTCSPNGPNATLELSSVNNFQDSVAYIPLGRQCTISEQAPKARPGCQWSTTYPHGNSVVVSNADKQREGRPFYQREVRNRLHCKGSGLSGPAISLPGGAAVNFAIACTTAGDCGDGNACNGVEICSSGTCAAGPPLVCDDGSACTTDSCSPAAGCLYTDNNTCGGSPACCAPDWTSVPASSYNNPQIIAACSAATQAQCTSNAAISCLWDPKCGGGASPLGCCLQRGPKTPSFVDCSGFPAGGTKDQCKNPCQWNPLNNPRCGGEAPTGSILVTKRIRNRTSTPTPDSPFQVRLDCEPGGPHQLLSLTSPSNLQQIVTVPFESACKISEIAPAAPRGCHWETSYPNDQEGKVGSKLVVDNELLCDEKPTGTLTVTKKIRNRTATPAPDAPFQVRLDCHPGGPHQILSLTSPNNLQQAVTVPLGSACKIVEIPPAAPRGCHWETSYPNDQEGKAGSKFVVENELLCDERPTGSLTVTKAVITDLRGDDSPPDPSFSITVTCGNGFSQTLHLHGGDDQTISNLPAGTTCTLNETITQTAFMSFPRSCATARPSSSGLSDFGLSSLQGPAAWAPPAYSPGPTVTIAAGANAAKVTNNLRCFVGTIGTGAGGGRR